MFNKPYVQETLSSTNLMFYLLCSTIRMVNKPYAQQTLVQQTQCSTNPMFNKNSVFKKTVLRRVFLLSAKERSGEHPRTPVGLVAWALYGRFRSRAFHEVWCPKEIGRDSWVREATGVSVQSPPPKNWRRNTFVCEHVRRKTERPHNT